MIPLPLWIGLDLGHKQTHVCIIDNAGEPIVEQYCETSSVELQNALTWFPTRLIGLIAVEAGVGTHVVRELRDAGFPVTVFESRKASRFLALRRNKTDASDARGLADLARLGQHTVSQVHVKSLACQQLRGQLVMRKKLVLIRVVIDSSIRSRLALYGLRFKRTVAEGKVRSQVATELERLKPAEVVGLSDDLMPLVDLAENLRTYLKGLDRRLEDRAKSIDTCRLLMEVPGVGPICALSFYTAIEDPSRFGRPSDVAAYLGLVPRRYQSGELSRVLGITKTGSTLTRAHLVNSALAFGSSAQESALKDWYIVLRERTGAKRARVALARKLSIVLMAMWKRGVHFEPYPARSSAASVQHEDGKMFFPAAEGRLTPDPAIEHSVL